MGSDDMGKSGFWAMVGKISMAIALIVGAMTIWEKYNAPGVKLEASVFWGPNLKQPDQDEFLLALSEILSPAGIVGVIQKDVNPYAIQPIPEKSVEWLARSLSRAVDRLKTEKLLDRAGYWKILVINSGDLIIKGATLRVPDAGIAKVIIDGKSRIDRQFPEIEIGNIAPGGVVEVYAWTSSSYSHNFENVSIYHSEGKGKVIFPEQKGVIRSLLGDPFGIFIVGFIFCMFLLGIYIWGYSGGEKAGLKKVKDGSDLPSIEIVEKSEIEIADSKERDG